MEHKLICLGKWVFQQIHGIEYVHPTFLYESVADFVVFLILIKLSKKRKYSSQIVTTYLIAYSFIRFWIEGLRTDSLMLGSIRISQMISLIIFVASIVYVMHLKRKRK